MNADINPKVSQPIIDAYNEGQLKDVAYQIGTNKPPWYFKEWLEKPDAFLSAEKKAQRYVQNLVLRLKEDRRVNNVEQIRTFLDAAIKKDPDPGRIIFLLKQCIVNNEFAADALIQLAEKLGLTNPCEFARVPATDFFTANAHWLNTEHMTIKVPESSRGIKLVLQNSLGQQINMKYYNYLSPDENLPSDFKQGFMIVMRVGKNLENEIAGSGSPYFSTLANTADARAWANLLRTVMERSPLSEAEQIKVREFADALQYGFVDEPK